MMNEVENPEQQVSELEQKIWAVITDQDVAAMDISYNEASFVVNKLNSVELGGLCVVTSDAAARIEAKLEKPITIEERFEFQERHGE
jgi:hypothetical protein